MKTKIDFGKVNIRKFDLQIFAEDNSPIQGSKILYYYRLLENRGKSPGLLIAFQTEGSETLSRDSDTTATKSGPIPVPGTLELEHSFTALVAKDGTAERELYGALIDAKEVELWRVNLGRIGSGEQEGKYEAEYCRGLISQFEFSADAEDFANYATTFKGKGTPKINYLNVTKEEAEAIDYAFAGLEKVVTEPQ